VRLKQQRPLAQGRYCKGKRKWTEKMYPISTNGASKPSSKHGRPTRTRSRDWALGYTIGNNPERCGTEHPAYSAVAAGDGGRYMPIEIKQAGCRIKVVLENEDLKHWMRRQPEIVHEVLRELDTEMLALMVHDRNYLGGYLIHQLKEAKQNQEELDAIPEEVDEEDLDRRERARDMQIQLERGW
jgi:hypothetical protein